MYDLPANVITGPSRFRLAVFARATVAAVMRERGYTLVQIGNVLGGRDHSTVLNLLKNTCRLSDEIAELRELAGNLADPGPGARPHDRPRNSARATAGGSDRPADGSAAGST